MLIADAHLRAGKLSSFSDEFINCLHINLRFLNNSVQKVINMAKKHTLLFSFKDKKLL